jgi:hypothetical protein
MIMKISIDKKLEKKKRRLVTNHGKGDEREEKRYLKLF